MLRSTATLLRCSDRYELRSTVQQALPTFTSSTDNAMMAPAPGAGSATASLAQPSDAHQQLQGGAQQLQSGAHDAAAATARDYRGFVAGVFSGVAKLSGA